MIILHYDGNLGNKLFQYCFARILATRLHYKLVANPIPGFPKTYDRVEGFQYSTLPKILRGQKPSLEFLTKNDPECSIILNGYFQRYEYYSEHVSEIKEWLLMDENIDQGTTDNVTITSNDLVLGVRRGRDYIPRHGMPLSYFHRAVESISYDRLYICTNDPDDSFVLYLAKKYRGLIRPPGALDNLAFIKKFKKIIISNSTFLWWAAFLSEAEEIIFPRPSNGYWSNNDPLSRNIALEVDEPRYRYVECEQYRSEFLSEIVENKMRVIIEGAKRTVRQLVRTKNTLNSKDDNLKFGED